MRDKETDDEQFSRINRDVLDKFFDDMRKDKARAFADICSKLELGK